VTLYYATGVSDAMKGWCRSMGGQYNRRKARWRFPKWIAVSVDDFKEKYNMAAYAE